MAVLTINQSSINTIIFDFDGTLATLNIDFQKMREIIRALILSYGISEDSLRSTFVLEMIDAAFELLNQCSRQKAKAFLSEAHAFIEKIELEAADKGELFDDTKLLLTSLQSKNISCGIITRNCAKAVKTVFPDILSHCSVVICRDDVTKVKPHPEHISLALTKLGSSARNTLMIGDHPIDITTGRNAGTKTCGVLSGRCQENDFIEVRADIILARAANILNIIQ